MEMPIRRGSILLVIGIAWVSLMLDDPFMRRLFLQVRQRLSPVP